MPSDTVRELQFRVGFAADSSITKVGGDVRKEIESIKRAAREREGPGLLGKLNESVGRKSEFAHVLHAAEGGGALLGIGLAGKMLAETTSKIVEMNDKWKQGEVSTREMVDEIARGIPIVGEFKQAADNIEELFSHRLRSEREVSRLLQEQTQYVQEHVRLAAEERTQTVELAKAIRQANQERNRVGIEGPGKAIASQRDQMQNAAEDAPQRLREENEKIRLSRQANINRQRNELHDVLQRVQRADGDAEREEAYRAGRNLEDSIEAQKKAMEDAIAEHTAQFNEQQKAQEEKGTAELGKLRADAGRERVEVERKAAEETAKVSESAGQQSLRAAGRDREADLEELKAALARQRAEIERDAIEKTRIAKSDTSEGPVDLSRIEKIQADAEARKAAVQKKFDADVADANRKGGERDFERKQSVEESILRVRLDGLKAEADAGNQAAAAEERKLERAQKYAEQRKAIVELMREENGLSAAQIATLKEALKASSAAEANEVKGEQRRAGRGLEGVALDDAQLAAAGGNRAAGIIAAKLRVAEQFRDQKEKLEGIAADTSLTPAQRDQARKMLADLPDAARSAVGRAGLEGQPFSPTAVTSDNAHGGNAGLTARAREEAFLRRSQQQQNKTADVANGYLKAILEALQKGPGAPPAFLD